MRMKLSNIVTGKLDRSIRVLLYGPEGIGKTTWAADSPAPIFLGAEDGTAQLDIARFPEPESWQDVFAAIEELHAEHSYKTIVIDTIDWIEPLCWKWVCENVADDKGRKHTSIDEYGWGRGYNAALDQWRRLLGAIDSLRERRKMDVVMLAHTQVKNHKNPMGPDFDRYEMKLHAKSAGLIREWVDAVLFAQYETFTQDQDGRAKGIDSGARVVYAERRAGFEAKNRLGLPSKLALSYADFAEATKGQDPAVIVAAIQAAAAGLEEVDRTKVAELLKKAGKDTDKLNKLSNWVAAKGSKQ